MLFQEIQSSDRTSFLEMSSDYLWTGSYFNTSTAFGDLSDREKIKKA